MKKNILIAVLFASTSAFGQQAAKNSDFAFRLYSEMKATPGNIIVSPNSISEAMAMVYSGAGGTTKEQIAKTMGFNMNFCKHFKSFKTVNNSLAKTKSVELYRANSIWVESTFRPKNSFIRKNTKLFGAAIFKTDFLNNANKSRKDINLWVEGNTKNRIMDLLPEGSIDNNTRMVLVNSIYFYGSWETAFSPKATQKETFNSPSKPIEVNFLHANGEYQFNETEDYKIVEVPFKGSEVVLLAFLPSETAGMTSLEAQLSPEFVKQASANLKKAHIDLKLPKIKLETESVRIDKHLATMGMPLAFSSDADFSGISKNQDLQIDKIFHKAFLEFTEEGAEAAAATAVIISRTAINPKDALRFWANRPFIFLIWDKTNNVILFMGRIETPNA
ncbi:serpin family protein [Williamwhitmania taraxaci]|uniref:Serpin B n=1 Tax=Williamwhitmania taraxaci TaxID=1640674 RepID=A0A1G6QUJ0_9BACT|nr:serpin family protein [Williamwhitmania taraxaci]SDC95982.1 serpin B [Williamwhitmania taraxaci]